MSRHPGLNGIEVQAAQRGEWIMTTWAPPQARLTTGLSMSGNTIRRFTNTTVLAVCAIEAPDVVTSAEFDERLAGTYARVRMRPGLLERLVGIRERRWWPAGFSFVDGAVAAGAKALSECGIDASDIGLMLNTSVSRQFLEPSTAVAVHHALGLPTSCQNFDITNACLGFPRLRTRRGRRGQPGHPRGHPVPAQRLRHHLRRRDVRIRCADAGIRRRGDGPRPGGPAS